MSQNSANLVDMHCRLHALYPPHSSHLAKPLDMHGCPSADRCGLKPVALTHLSTLALLFSHTRKYCTRKPLALYIGTCSHAQPHVGPCVETQRSTLQHLCTQPTWAASVRMLAELGCQVVPVHLHTVRRCSCLQFRSSCWRVVGDERTWKLIWMGGRAHVFRSRVVVTRSTLAPSVCSCLFAEDDVNQQVSRHTTSTHLPCRWPYSPTSH